MKKKTEKFTFPQPHLVVLHPVAALRSPRNTAARPSGLRAPAPARQPRGRSGRGGARRGAVLSCPALPHLREGCCPPAAMDVGAADFARCLPSLRDRVGRAAFLGERCALGWALLCGRCRPRRLRACSWSECCASETSVL